MSDNKPTKWKLLKEYFRKWINLVLKVNKGYELDDKEIERLGRGFMDFDVTSMPKDIKIAIKNAEKYYLINNTKKSIRY